MPVITDPEVFPLHHETGAIGPVRPGGPAPGGIGRLEGDRRCIGRRAAATAAARNQRVEVSLAGDGLGRVALVVHQLAADDHVVADLDVGLALRELRVAEIEDAEAVELILLRAVVGNVEGRVAIGAAFGEGTLALDPGNPALHVHVVRRFIIGIARPRQALDGIQRLGDRVRVIHGAGRRRVPARRIAAGGIAARGIAAHLLDEPGIHHLNLVTKRSAVAPDPDPVAGVQAQRGIAVVILGAISQRGRRQAIDIDAAGLVLQVEESVRRVDIALDRSDQLINLGIGLWRGEELRHGNGLHLVLALFLRFRLFPAGGQKGRHDHERKEQLLGFHFVPFINPSILRPIRVL